jgi:predicted nucleic acid-binding protein
MKIFIDANILVATLNREYPLYTWSARILSLQGKNNIRICTSPFCLAIAFYFASKKSGKWLLRKKLTFYAGIWKSQRSTVKLHPKALSNPKITDFEDGLEYYSAVNQGCEWIITEDREDFWFSELKVAGCEEFLKMI